MVHSYEYCHLWFINNMFWVLIVRNYNPMERRCTRGKEVHRKGVSSMQCSSQNKGIGGILKSVQSSSSSAIWRTDGSRVGPSGWFIYFN